MYWVNVIVDSCMTARFMCMSRSKISETHNIFNDYQYSFYISKRKTVDGNRREIEFLPYKLNKIIVGLCSVENNL